MGRCKSMLTLSAASSEAGDLALACAWHAGIQLSKQAACAWQAGSGSSAEGGQTWSPVFGHLVKPVVAGRQRGDQLTCAAQPLSWSHVLDTIP